MKIVVCAKQVPDTTEVKLDPKTNTLIRDGVPSIINPDDKAGIEAALQLKEKCPGSTVTVVSMGPPQADVALREALAMGCDDALLISDRAFGGADTWATSSTIAAALKKLDYDVIITGRQAIDGDTAQVGPEIAEHMDLPHVTLATAVEMADGKLHVTRDTDEGHDLVEVSLPALVTVTKTTYDPRYPTIKSKMAANRAVIEEITNSDPDMVCELERLGLNGSPTKVKKTFTPVQTKDAVILNEETGSESAVKLAALLSEAKII